MSEFNDILHSIRKIANEHEEPYKVGSWETFLKTKKKKKAISLWPLIVSGLAASLIIGFFVINQTFDENSTINNLANNFPTIKDSFEIITEEKIATNQNITQKKETEPGQMENISHEKGTINSIPREEINRNLGETGKAENETFASQKQVNEKQALEQDNPVAAPLTDTTKKSNPRREIPNSLIEDLVVQTPGRGKSSRLNLGFSISPLLISNESGNNLGVAVGVQTDIQIADGVYINSGLTFAHQKIDNVYTDRTSFSEPISLTSRIFSFDIPINFKFTLKKEKNKESYLLAGISSVGYLGERNKYTYEYEEIIEVTTESGGQESTAYHTIVTETSVENNQPAFSTFDFAGFINISYGLKSPLFKNTHLTFEPYLKLPINGATSNNLIYTSGGVKLIISK